MKAAVNAVLFNNNNNKTYSPRRVGKSSEKFGNGNPSIRICIYNLQALLNFCFYTFFIPYRIVLNGFGQYKTKTSTIQRIICGILNGLCCAQGVLLTRGAYTGKIVEKPGILFTIWSMSHCALFTMIWTYTFWFKSHKLIQMINSMDKSAFKLKLKTKVTGLLTPCLIAIYYITYLSIIVIRGRHDSVSSGFRRYTTRGFYELFLIRERNISYIPETEELKPLELIISLTYTGIRTYGMIIIGMTCAIIFISAFVVDQAINKTIALCDMAFDDEKISVRLKDIIEAYLKVKKFVSLVNELNRPFLLVLCSANVPFFARRLIATFDTGRWSFKVIILINLLSHLVPFAMSAEAYHKAGILKTRLLNLSHKNNDTVYSKMILRDEIGLEGGGFFTVSYGFLGSVGSACLSYAILLLQMQPPPNCGSGEEDF